MTPTCAPPKAGSCLDLGCDVILLDDTYPEHERLPRLMRVEISSHGGHACTSINGWSFGDRLTDNQWYDDGYRFHDIFHIAHVTFLGWSPTLRGLLRRKRKSNPRVDEVEDGGRAIVIEEGLTAFVFAYAESQDFFANIPGLQSSGDEMMLQAIRLMTQHLEVSIRTRDDWEAAIMHGYWIWRNIRADNGGRFIANLDARTMEIEL